MLALLADASSNVPEIVNGLAATFAVGTFWFWMLIAAEVILLLVFENFKQGIASTVSVVAFIGFLQFGAKVNVFAYIMAHWYAILPIAGAYIILGALWAVFKWRRLIVGRLELYNEKFTDYLKDCGLPADTKILPENRKDGWIRIVESTKRYSDWTNAYESITDTPQVKNHKADVLRWMSLWVFSFLLYMFKDLVADIFKGIYRRIAKFLQKMADDMWPSTDIKANLQKAETTNGDEASQSRRSNRDGGYNT